jgi:transposase-like protein
MVSRVVHEVMAEEVETLVGAGRYERREGRTGWRNGTRSRPWDTRVGTIDLEVPRVRGDVAYFPSFLEYRRRSERASMAALVEMVLKKVSTRKAEHVLQVMGVEGMSASQLSRFIGRLDEHVRAFREAPIDGGVPVRVAGREVRAGAQRRGGRAPGGVGGDLHLSRSCRQ